MGDRFSKLYIALKNRLYGAEMFKAMEALEICREIHDGFRKDGKTPEYQHQLEIALYLLTLKNIPDLEEVIIVALFHDVLEDYPEKIDGQPVIEKFGNRVYRCCYVLNKNNFSDMAQYFQALLGDWIAILVKLADRVNNFQSMNRGKFTIEKQEKYASEVSEYFLPNAKKARKKYPQLMDAFYNVETMLKHQHELITLFIGAKNENG